MILERIEAVEDAVVKSLLAQLVPDVLDRVEFGCVRRQAQKPHVGWRPKLAAGVPARTVEHHHDVLVRVASSDFIAEQLHTVRVDVRQDQRVELAAEDVDGGIGVGVLVGQHGLAQWAQRLGRPAAAHVVDAPEARLVLEHQLDRGLARPERADLGEAFGEFFFHACCASGSLCGWRLSGASLRQPCRCSRLYTEDSAMGRPKAASNSALTWPTTRMPPVRARSRNGASTARSCAAVIFWRRSWIGRARVASW